MSTYSKGTSPLAGVRLTPDQIAAGRRGERVKLTTAQLAGVPLQLKEELRLFEASCRKLGLSA
jgi:hypothetical protein